MEHIERPQSDGRRSREKQSCGFSNGKLIDLRDRIAVYVAEESLKELIASLGGQELRVDKTFPLAEAGEAHKALAGRGTTGKLLLLP